MKPLPATMGTVSVAIRLDACSFPHPVRRLTRVQTALSWVLLTGHYAYKIKKPMRLSFVDASTPARRRVLCRQELRLNRRFSAELYLDVLPIIEREGRLVVGADDDVDDGGPPVDYCVQMRQFDRRRHLANELSAGRATRADLVELGQRLAAWHARAAIDTGRFGTPAVVDAQLRDNFAQLHAHGSRATLTALAPLQAWTDARFAALRPLLARRQGRSRVRECHGDLHAGNIVRWQRRLQPFDCVEFDPALRWIDVASDVAFLYMDLVALGHAPLAADFVSAYVEADGDYQALRLLSFFAVYRALVRAKVDALALSAAGADRRGPLRQRLHARLRVAARLARERPPALLLMRGVTGSGKSWLSERLIGALGAVRVRSDLERRRLFGSGAYSAAATRATYTRLRNCAAEALAAGLPVIVDAGFLPATQRVPFQRLAARQRCPCIIVDCQAPRAVLIERIARRAAEGRDPSEATAQVLDAQLRAHQPLARSPGAHVLTLDTSAPHSAARAIRALRTLMARLPDAQEH